MIRRVFPSIPVGREAIVFRFSGVRPLPTQAAAATGQISRDHRIEASPASDRRPFPIYSLVGGKWTTFRAFAEEAADLALGALGLARSVSTADLPIGGGRDFPSTAPQREACISSLAGNAAVPPSRMAELFDRYGTAAGRPAAYISSAPDSALAGAPGCSRREIEYLALNEKVVQLDDLLLRRTSLGILGCLDTGLVREVAESAGHALGWDRDRQRLEVDRSLQLLRERHHVELV
jgi:glycerol-3-phosphate dehydrogenase